MAAETKIVKGGFRATLALILSIVALLLSIYAYMSTEREEDFKDLQTKLENMKKESAKQVDKLRGETAEALEKLGKAIKKEEKPQ